MRRSEPVPPVSSLNGASWFSGEFQQSVNAAFSGSFGLRPQFVRLSNQLYFSFLHRSFMDNSTIIVGKEGQLYQSPYLLDYSFIRPENDKQMVGFVDLLERAHEKLTARGQMFIYLTSPSKAIWHSETLPDFYQTNALPGLRRYEMLRPLLSEATIPFVDAARLTGFANNDPRDPPFPRGGIHWSDTRAFGATQALVEKLNAVYHRNLPVPVAESVEYRTENAKEVDADLSRLLFVLFPPVDYAHSVVHAVPGNGQPGNKAVYVGSSFSEPVANYLRDCDVFDAVDYYFYYTIEKNREPLDPSTIDWEGDILQADAIIVESNESALPGDHIIHFLNDLLARIEAEESEK